MQLIKYLNIGLLTIGLWILCAIENEAYRILCIFPFQSRSHQLMFDGIMKGLVRMGHQVDVVTVYPFKTPVPNYKVIVNLEGKTSGFINRFNITYATDIGSDTLPWIALPFGNGLCEYLGLPEIQNIIRNPPQDPPYDLVMTEAFGANCFIALGHVLKVPVVLASTTIPLPWLIESLGQPPFSAFMSGYFTAYVHPMSFLIRVINTIQNHISDIRFRRYTDRVQDAQIRKYIDPNIPPLRELEKNVTLALVNTWHSLHGVQPITPGLVEIGGIHVQEHYVPMSKELEKWMNDSTAGVIYFTLGSMVNIETFPEPTMKAIYSVFRRIAPVRVLMKVANDSALLPGLPDNIKTSSWIPQVALLAHKNTKIFITHGGLMSTLEALTFGVPLIGIPLFGDQHNNIATYKSHGIALQLDLYNITEKSLFWAVNEILNNPKYSETAKYQSKKFLDRPMSAMDTTIFWVEYAIRHGPGALRSPIVDLPWWQVELIDVYGFLALCLLAIVYSILRLIKFALSEEPTNPRKRVKRD
ncbi:UDP-glucuronosyltransferase [Fopius arisanus]|uniref:UDP-glucuronosyltransferase n=2 Tax=Fopius arisanus TaxID=64838 RepID=A0A9R1UBL5_9HYME|nr:PREDICTED: UDP-glucuronosyltransferase-like [Fopius arisanus]